MAKASYLFFYFSKIKGFSGSKSSASHLHVRADALSLDHPTLKLTHRGASTLVRGKKKPN